MKLLLDTHAVLWWVRDDRRLKERARRAIATADTVWVSAATAWEIGVKVSRGQWRTTEPVSITITNDDLTELPVSVSHAEQIAQLPWHHRDPIDRILIGQAGIEGATIVTHDRAFEAYGVPL